MSIKPGYTRVSEILAQWEDYVGVEKSVLERKAALGTQVHEAIMGFHEGIYLPVSPEAQGYFESFKLWQQRSKPKLQAIGRLYCEKLKITGEIDALCTFDPGQQPSQETFVLDWKTTAMINESRWKLQGQFYHYLCKANGLPIGERFMFIQLQKDGSYPKVKVYDTSKELLNVCMSAYVCYKYMKDG
jgi:hypothetical protein